VLRTAVRPARGGGSPETVVYDAPGLVFMGFQPTASWRRGDLVSLTFGVGGGLQRAGDGSATQPIINDRDALLWLQGRLRWRRCRRGLLLQALIRRGKP
jgi:hypothetical protein